MKQWIWRKDHMINQFLLSLNLFIWIFFYTEIKKKKDESHACWFE